MLFLKKHKFDQIQPEDALPGRSEQMPVPERHEVLGTPLSPPFPEGLEQAVFGMGCFWGAERKFWQAPGVYTTAVGYAGGFTPNPTYKEVCSGQTGHTEVGAGRLRPGEDELRRDAPASSGRTTTRPRACGRATTWARSTARPIYTARTRSAKRPRRRATRFQEALTAAGYGADHDRDRRGGPFYYAEDYHQQYLAKMPNGYCGIGGTGVSCPVGVAKASQASAG